MSIARGRLICTCAKGLAVVAPAFVLVTTLVYFASSQDADVEVGPQANAWSDLAKEYLAARENLWPIVPPSEVFTAADTTAVKAETLAAWQEMPLWFIPFEMGVWYYGDLSPLAAEVAPGTEAAVFDRPTQPFVAATERLARLCA